LQSKLRNANNGSIRDYRFRMTEGVDRVFTEAKPCIFSYRSGSNLVFLDNESYEEYTVEATSAGDSIRFFEEGDNMELSFADGELLGIKYPEYVTRTVASTMHDVKAAKATNQVKPATLDTGVEIGVPIFIKEGDRIRISCETGKYHERVK
jgi:elongation factor P